MDKSLIITPSQKTAYIISLSRYGIGFLAQSALANVSLVPDNSRKFTMSTHIDIDGLTHKRRLSIHYNPEVLYEVEGKFGRQAIEALILHEALHIMLGHIEHLGTLSGVVKTLTAFLPALLKDYKKRGFLTDEEVDIILASGPSKVMNIVFESFKMLFNFVCDVAVNEKMPSIYKSKEEEMGGVTYKTFSMLLYGLHELFDLSCLERLANQGGTFSLEDSENSDFPQNEEKQVKSAEEPLKEYSINEIEKILEKLFQRYFYNPLSIAFELYTKCGLAGWCFSGIDIVLPLHLLLKMFALKETLAEFISRLFEVLKKEIESEIAKAGGHISLSAFKRLVREKVRFFFDKLKFELKEQGQVKGRMLKSFFDGLSKIEDSLVETLEKYFRCPGGMGVTPPLVLDPPRGKSTGFIEKKLWGARETAYGETVDDYGELVGSVSDQLIKITQAMDERIPLLANKSEDFKDDMDRYGPLIGLIPGHYEESTFQVFMKQLMIARYNLAKIKYLLRKRDEKIERVIKEIFHEKSHSNLKISRHRISKRYMVPPGPKFDVTSRYHLIVAIDTSGSISEKTFSAFLIFLLSVAKAVHIDPVTVPVIFADIDIKAVVPFSHLLDVMNNNPERLVIVGRGGTSFIDVFERVANRELKYTSSPFTDSYTLPRTSSVIPPGTRPFLIYLTDGMGEFPDPPLAAKVKTLWVITVAGELIEELWLKASRGEGPGISGYSLIPEIARKIEAGKLTIANAARSYIPPDLWDIHLATFLELLV